MTLYRGGEVWWYEFNFRGQRIRKSAFTSSTTAALQIERERRRELEFSAGGVRQRKPLLFNAAAKAWLAESAHWSDSTLTELAGWMSRKMLERYSHTRNEAKRRAVELLVEGSKRIGGDSPQNPHRRKRLERQFSKSLILNGGRGGT